MSNEQPKTSTERAREIDGSWICYRHLDEDFTVGETYETRQDAIDGYADEYGEIDGAHFQTGRVHFRRQIPACPIDADRMFERASEALSSEWTEGVIEQWEDKTADADMAKELDDKLEQLWEAFCEKYDLYVEGYDASDVESHIVGEDESEEELARRAKESV